MAAGTGGHIIVPMLRGFGFEVLTVPEQDIRDGRFPTVKSPNPENAPALKMAVDLANKEGADIVIGTDPDCDRMGVGVRNDKGEMVLLTGNQTGSLIAAYTTDQLIYGYGLTNNTKNLVTSSNGLAGKRDFNALVDGDYPAIPMYFMASNLGFISLPSARGFGMMGITHGVNSDAMAVSLAGAVNTLVNELRA